MKVLVTGAAGFIGFHLSKALLSRGDDVVGLDNLNDYYDPNLKLARLELLKPQAGFCFYKQDLADYDALDNLFADQKFDIVVNLAAQAGVRYSITHPLAYSSSNLQGFMHVLECCRQHHIKHLVYASSSSVYGANTVLPFSVHHNVDHPVSLYAATKKANELMAHSYSHLYQLPTTGLRFFTVYGPWGRPDMALFKFTKAILAGEPIEVYNHGNMKRDFTYIDDIIQGVVKTMDCPPEPNPKWDSDQADPGTSSAPYRVFNIGNNKPENLLEFIEQLEKSLGISAEKHFKPMQMGDVHQTAADIEDIRDLVGFQPTTPISEGIPRFVDWYREHYQN